MTKPARRRARSISLGVSVNDVMSRTLVCVEPDLDLPTLAREMLERSISGCPVVDGDGRAVGFVSKTDLVGASIPGFRRRRAATGRRRGRRASRALKVADVMTPVLFSVEATEKLPAALELLVRSGVHHLVVRGEDERVVGILSAMDVVRHLARR